MYGAGTSGWALRNDGVSLNFATTSITTYATTSMSALTLNNVGDASLSVGSSTPTAAITFDINGTSFMNQFYLGTGATTSLRITNNGAVFIPGATQSASTQTYYGCASSAFELIWDTTTCLISSLRFKRDVRDLNMGLDTVLKLRPVNYFLKKPVGINDAVEQFGFIAEEAAEVDTRLVAYDNESQPKAFRYEQFTAVLAQAIQDLNQKVNRIERGAEENWQWFVMGIFLVWIVRLEVKVRLISQRK